MVPLDDIFQIENKPTIQQKKEKQLRTIFEWIVSFSIIFWSIAIVANFGNDILFLLKSILVIGFSIIVISALLSLILALFDYKRYSFYNRFYHLWLLIVSLISSVTILISLYMTF